MISTIRHKALRRLFETGDGKGLPPEMVSRLKRMISTLHATDDLKLLDAFSGWRLHPLKGDLAGYWSLSVSGNWRLVFKWRDGVAEDVDLVDYH